MTIPAAVAFSGRLGSGKSTLAHEVSASLGWPLASFGGYLRLMAAFRGLPDTRETLQELGATFIAREGPRPFSEMVLRSAGWKLGQPIVIEGVRHASVASALRELTAPLPLVLVYLQTSEEIRLQRLERRSEKELTRLSSIEGHSTEADVRETLRGIADLLVDSDQELPLLVKSVIAALHVKIPLEARL